MRAKAILSLCVAAALTAGGDARAQAPGQAPRGDTDARALHTRLQLGQQYQREGTWIAVAGGAGLALSGFLIYRGATTCDRWREADNNDDHYLCVFSEIGYYSLGTTVGLLGVTGVVAGVIRWRLGDDMEAEASRGLSLSVVPGPDGAAASLTLRF